MSEIANKTILELTSLNEYLENDAIPVLRPNLHEDNCIALSNIIWYDKSTKQLIINGKYRFDMSSLIQANISIKLTGDSGINNFTYNGESYDKGDSIESEEPFNATITAIVNPHYNFSKWQFKGLDILASSSNTLLYNFTESGELSASTTPKSYTITVNTNNAEWGTISSSGSWGYGTSRTITATANNGYRFVKWTKGSEEILTNPYDFIVTEDATFTAFFEPNTNVPTVTTSDVRDITLNSATCGGNVTSDGNSAIIARGVCWSTSSNPTIENNHTSDGTGTGSFISNITGLTLNTTYHIRAYATNSIGTAYGLDKTFKTEDYPDYYIGFYEDPEDYLSASNDDLINNAKVSSTIAKDPNYPSSDSDDYIYYQNNEKMMYLIYNENYTVKIDTDNPGGNMFDLTGMSVELIHMPIFNRSQITKNNKTYNILATYNPGNTSENGYRFKFSNN